MLAESMWEGSDLPLGRANDECHDPIPIVVAPTKVVPLVNTRGDLLGCGFGLPNVDHRVSTDRKAEQLIVTWVAEFHAHFSNELALYIFMAQ